MEHLLSLYNDIRVNVNYVTLFLRQSCYRLRMASSLADDRVKQELNWILNSLEAIIDLEVDLKTSNSCEYLENTLNDLRHELGKVMEVKSIVIVSDSFNPPAVYENIKEAEKDLYLFIDNLNVKLECLRLYNKNKAQYPTCRELYES